MAETPRGRGFGERQKFEQARSDLQAAPSAPAGGQAAPAPSEPSELDRLKSIDFPSNTLGQGTARPNEPVSAGLSSGPGPGPSSSPPIPRMAPNTNAALYAKSLPLLEVLASTSRATPAFRQYVRKLRAATPPGIQAEIANNQAGVDRDT